MAETREIVIPESFHEIWQPWRYKVYYGGRGSAKSHTIARYLLIRALEGKIRILCVREFQASIRDSVHRLLSDLIIDLEMTDFFDVQNATITSVTGSQFLFAGLAHNITSIKSFEGVDVCWCEEAENISEHSWEVLIPTIRKPKSEIIISFNPAFEDDPTYRRFVLGKGDDILSRKVNYDANPFFPEVLEKERQRCFENDPERHDHVWGGNTRTTSDALIFKGKFVVQYFKRPREEEIVFRYGADWGFGTDPSSLIECYIHDDCLYISREAYGYKVDLDQLKYLWKGVLPWSSRYKILADNSRPETINFMQKIENGGYNVAPADKWKGSVEDGIDYMRAFKKIIIHPDCKNTLDEFKSYSYKIDRLTEDVLPIIIDANNHSIDAIRYALTPLITRRVTIFDEGVI